MRGSSFWACRCFYLPYLRHPTDDTGRESGLLIPVVSNGSSIRGYTFGEQVYWAINRSMDMVVGTEYYSKRGWAPNGDFRYKGPGLDHLMARWNALIDRGIEESRSHDESEHDGAGEPGGRGHSRAGAQGPVGRILRVAGNMEYLSSYVYRLVFNDNYSQAVSSEVQSVISMTQNHNGYVASGSAERFQTFASSTAGRRGQDSASAEPAHGHAGPAAGGAQVYWGLGSSLG